MNIGTQYEINQKVYIIKDSKLVEGKVASIKIDIKEVETTKNTFSIKEEIIYSLYIKDKGNILYSEDNIGESPEQLLEKLKFNLKLNS